MTATKIADASPQKAAGWHDIDWRAAHRFVRRLQARIVKAVKQGKWREVKNLQRLLSHSRWSKVLAIKRVTENRGKRTPGVDGETWRSANQKWSAIGRLRKTGYRPKPLRRIYIPKRNGKKRPISIPTMLDRAQQALYLQGLEPVAETTADPHSFGFRRERSTADAITQCNLILGREHSAEWVLEGDIKGCFDHISHEWLESNIPMDQDILRKWLTCGYMDNKRLFPTDEGTPQGGIASPVLANLTLDGLEQQLRQKYPPRRHQGTKPKVNYVRYADDFIVTAKSRELLENEIKPMIQEFLTERGLSLSEEKTRITHIDEGFDFLGYHLRRLDGNLRTTPSKSNVKRLKVEVKETIDKFQGRRATDLIVALNRKVTGWGNYYRNVSSAETFAEIDSYIFWRLWSWVRKRHPGKPVRWRKQRYFPSVGGTSWTFSGRQDNGREQRLIALSSLTYRRHYQVKAEANPFDPEWSSYFAERAWIKAQKAGLSRTLIARMDRQKGICPLCGQELDLNQSWKLYQTQHQSTEEKDTPANKIIVHQACQNQQKWRQNRRTPDFASGSSHKGL